LRSFDLDSMVGFFYKALAICGAFMLLLSMVIADQSYALDSLGSALVEKEKNCDEKGLVDLIY
jgi:hypothetical protein